MMLHPSSHKTPNNISGAVFILGKMWIAELVFLVLVDGM